MLEGYLYYSDLSRPLTETLEEIARLVDDEWGLLVTALLHDPLMPLPEWLDPAERALVGRLGYCLMSGEQVWPIP